MKNLNSLSYVFVAIFLLSLVGCGINKIPSLSDFVVSNNQGGSSQTKSESGYGNDSSSESESAPELSPINPGPQTGEVVSQVEEIYYHCRGHHDRKDN